MSTQYVAPSCNESLHYTSNYQNYARTSILSGRQHHATDTHIMEVILAIMQGFEICLQWVQSCLGCPQYANK